MSKKPTGITNTYAAAIRMLSAEGMKISPERYGDTAVIKVFENEEETVRLRLSGDGRVALEVYPGAQFHYSFMTVLSVARMISDGGKIGIRPIRMSE